MTGGMDGSNLMAGFELQELGIGFEVNLNYNILERWGVTAGIGSGYRCFRMVHKANHDSVPIVNPNSTVDTYIRISRFIEIPTYVSYTFFRHLDVGVRASFPILVSYGIRADPDTSFTGFMDWDFPLNMNSTTVEMYLGYHFRIGNLIMTPTFSFGGPVRSVHRRLFTDVGLRINYVSHEK